MTPLTPEMIERAARAIHDLMGPYLGTPEQIAKHGDRVAARQLETAEKYATVALTAALSCPDGFRLVPVDPTTEMLKAYSVGLKNYISTFDAAERQARWGSPKKGRGFELPEWEKAIARYRAMLAASPAPAVDNAGWRPIETARKDALRFTSATMLLAHSEKKWIRFGQFYVQEGVWYYSGTNERSQWAQVRGDEPTHWQPLPSAPSQDAPPPRSLSKKD